MTSDRKVDEGIMHIQVAYPGDKDYLLQLFPQTTLAELLMSATFEGWF